MALRGCGGRSRPSQKGTDKTNLTPERGGEKKNEQAAPDGGARASSPAPPFAPSVSLIYYVALAVHMAVYTDASAQMCLCVCVCVCEQLRVKQKEKLRKNKKRIPL